MQKKLHTLMPFFLLRYVVLQALLGVAVLNGWLLLILPVCALLFGLHRTNPRLKKLLPAIFLGNVAFMMVVISWFKNIEAFGWQDIGPFSPNLVLMIALLAASTFCSLFITGLWFLGLRLIRSTSFDIQSSSYIYVWGVVMMLGEIVRTTSFSLFVSHSEAPIEPSLNLFSVGPLLHGTPLSPLSRLVGFWGSSFIVFTTSALLFFGARYLLGQRNTQIQRRARRRMLLLIGTVLTMYALSAISLPAKSNVSSTMNVVAVSQQSQDTLYLQKLAETLSANDSANPTVVVLPEYSGLLHPFSEASLFNATYDGRKELPKLLAGKPVYIVGTENELSKNGRFVETYIVDSELKKIKRSEKTFLIPGGEYVPSWIAHAIGKVDPYAVISFSSSRSRGVLGEDLPIDRTDSLSRTVATGPCSAVLTPFHFRKQVTDGATLLTSNVSYEQFTKAPEYSAYVQRFARFSAYSMGRPFVIGATAGDAMIYDHMGNVLGSSDGGLTVEQTFENLSEKRNIYTLFGDTVIVAVLILVALVFTNTPSALLRLAQRKLR